MSLPFLNPWLLLALPAVGLPVLIHLLNRHRAKTVEWGAMELLRRVMVVRTREIRLEDILLMLVRCLLILLVVLAVARPSSRWLPVIGGQHAGLVVAVDGSLSMTHRPGVRSRFEEAVERARTVFQTAAPGQPVSLVLLGEQPRVLIRHTTYEPAAVAAALDGLQPAGGPLDLDANLAELRHLVLELKAFPRELHIVTDAQATTFDQLSGQARTILGEITAGGADVNLITLPGAGEENCGVTRLELSSGVLRAGALAQFQATVRNTGRAERNPGELTLLLNGQAVDQRAVGPLAPGQSTAVRFTILLPRAGINRLVAQLPADALPADDQFHAVVDVRATVRVLCVDGDPGERAEAKAVTFVATALAPTSFDPSESRPLVEQIAWTRLGGWALTDYDTVVLVNVGELPEQQVLALRRFVEQGGGLIILPGANLKAETFNRRFLAPDSAVAPAELLGLEESPAQQAAGVPLDLGWNPHPIVAPLDRLPREMLTDIRFYRYLRVRPLGDAQPVLHLGNAAPLLLDQRIGRGRVLFWTSGIDPRWSNLALNPAFPILLQQSITQLARRPYETPLTVAQSLVLPLPGLPPDQEIEVTDPDGQTTMFRSQSRHGEIVLATAPLTKAGFYDIKPGPNEPVMTVAANAPVAECDSRILGVPELTTGLAGLSVRLMPPDRDLTRAVLEARRGRELWLPLVLAALAVVGLEAWLARRYTKRGSSGS